MLLIKAAEATPSIRHVSAIPACHVRSRTVVKPEPQVQTNAGRLPGMGQAEASANRTASPENVTTCSGYAEPWYMLANCQQDNMSSDTSHRAHEGHSTSSSKGNATTAAPASTRLSIPAKLKRTSLETSIALRCGEQHHQRYLSRFGVDLTTSQSRAVRLVTHV